jgi:hypothetical protein
MVNGLVHEKSVQIGPREKRFRGTYKIIKINHFDVKYSLRTKILAKRQISTQIIL